MQFDSINPYRRMVFDAFGRRFTPEEAPLQNQNVESTHEFSENVDSHVEEPPNPRAQEFFNMLEAVESELWSGCKNYSLMSVVARLLNIKSEHHMSRDAMMPYVNF